MDKEAIPLEIPTSQVTPTAKRGCHVALVLLGLFMTVLNAFKPITVDDSVYYFFAIQIAQHPLDPYGFRAWGIQDANSILAPPVFLYWWAGAVRVFGDNIFCWKLSVLPFNLLLVYTLYGLGRRFVRGREMLFVCIVTLSAAILPNVNMMLDIPALALSLLAVLLFFRACSANSFVWALAAGVVAGIATQTKYTGFVAPGVMLLYAFHTGKWRLGLLASSLTGLLFVGWELLIAWRYGESHFWLGYTQFKTPLIAKLKLVQPLYGHLGGTLAAGLPLALAALGRSARLVWGTVALVTLVFVFVGFPPGAVYDYAKETLHIYPKAKFVGIVFGVLGFTLLGLVALSGWRLLRQPKPSEGLAQRWFYSVDGFLVFWMMLEIAGYFAISPFPATRRILGVVVLSLLLICRLTTRTCSTKTKLLWGLAGFNTLLGLLLFVVDFNCYYGQQVLVREVAKECQQQGPGANIWYFGNGTFEFYGDREGLKRMLTPGAVATTNDWVLLVEGFEHEYSRHPISSRCRLYGVREWNSDLRIHSLYQYGNFAVSRQEGPNVRVTLYRVE